MANIITKSTSLDPILTGLFYQKQQELADYGGLRAAPIRAINGLTSQYLALSTKLQLSLDQSDDAFGGTKTLPIGLNDTSRPTGVEFTTKSVELERYAAHAFINKRVRDHFQASSGFDVRQPAVDQLAHEILGVHAYKVWTGYTTAGNFGTAVTGGDLTTASTDFLTQILTQRETIYAETGRYPTHFFTGPKVANLMRLNDYVRNRPGAAIENSLATSDMLGQFFRDMFQLELVIVPAGYKSSGGTFTNFLDNDAAMVYLSPDQGTPSFAMTFAEADSRISDTGASLAGLTTEDSRDPQGEKIIADVMYKVQFENAGAGVLIQNYTIA